MAASKDMVMLMFVAIMSTLSAAFAQGDFSLAPAPAPDAGSGFSLPVSAAVVASSLLFSLMALIKN